MANKYSNITTTRCVMKNYKHIVSFGCSFTEGGGLNAPEHHRYLQKYNMPFSQQLDVYMKEHSYPSYLAKKLNCTYENYGTSKASNELILKSVYEYMNDAETTEGLLITIQTTILSRMLLYLEEEKKFESVNGIYGPTYIQDYYAAYIKYFYSKEIEYKKLMQNINVYSKFLDTKNVDYIWIVYDGDTDYIKPEKTIVSFDGLNLFRFGIENKLVLKDLPNYPTNDSHFSEKGNEEIAKKLYEHIEKYYGN